MCSAKQACKQGFEQAKALLNQWFGSQGYPMHIPASHILLHVDLNSVRKSAVLQAIGCLKPIMGLYCSGTRQ